MISKVLRPKAWASRTTNLHSWGVNRREADLGIDKTDTILFLLAANSLFQFLRYNMGNSWFHSFHKIPQDIICPHLRAPRPFFFP